MRKTIILLTLIVFSFSAYVIIVNRNSTDISMRQKILKAFYPLLTGITKLTGKNSNVHLPETGIQPPVSFYSLSVKLNNGQVMHFDSLKGKKVMLVNTASDCGYTAQYDELQQLQEMYKDKLVIIGFPANDFKEQEKGTDDEIAEFCRVNYGVTFPLAVKNSVKKGSDQQEVFNWLSNRKKNGWNDKAPIWNFSKYLVNDNGELLGYFEPSVSPTGKEIRLVLDAKE
ncbi:MAG: glutathione peroxidase [Chitinophagaceae bacterium]